MPNLLTGQELIRQNKPEKESLPASFWKLLALNIATVVLAFFAGRFGAEYLSTGAAFYATLAVNILFFAGVAFSSILANGRGMRTVITLLAVAFWSGGFYSILSVSTSLLSVSILAAFIFNFWADEIIAREMENRLHARFFSLSHKKIAKSFTGFLLASVIMLMPTWQSAKTLLPEGKFHAFWGETATIATPFAPDLKLDGTMEDLAESLARRQASAEPEWNNLSKNQQDAAVKTVAGQVLAQLGQSLNLQMRPQSSTADVAYDYFNSTLNSWRESFGGGFILFWAIAAFIFLRGLGFILIGLATAAAAIIYEALSAFGALSVIGEPVTREKIIIT